MGFAAIPGLSCHKVQEHLLVPVADLAVPVQVAHSQDADLIGLGFLPLIEGLGEIIHKADHRQVALDIDLLLMLVCKIRTSIHVLRHQKQVVLSVGDIFYYELGL